MINKLHTPKVSYTLKCATVLIVLGLLVACKKREDPVAADDNGDGVFDKQALLVNLADQVIIPSYIDLRNSLDSLTSAYNMFQTTGALSDFEKVRQRFDVVYLKYQCVSIFGFGPGEDVIVRANFNIFPTDTVKVKKNISTGVYDLSTASNTNAKGLPALDYLFYSGQTEVVKNLFVNNAARRQYTSALLSDMRVKAVSLVDQWQGSYRGTFINSLGTDVGSSLGFVVNQINYELDYLKNAKVATPLGLKSDGKPFPNYCEGVYGGQSLAYALETLTTIENVYLGRNSQGLDGKGFDDYLDHLGIKHGDNALNADIKNQFNVARVKLTEVGNPLSGQVLTNAAAVNTAYKELVKLLVLLKTDMPSGLGVMITYQDGDGD